MNDRILYNAQKNIIKEVCRSIASKHRFDDLKF